MYAPRLFATHKYPFRMLCEHDFAVTFPHSEQRQYEIKQADNLLFHQVRRITGDTTDCAKLIAFVDCKGCSADTENLTRLILGGFTVNGERFVLGERSASMTRNSILSFVHHSIADQLYEAVTMGSDPGPTVISKLMAYRGLMLSSCHCLDGFRPKVIVVPDYEAVLPNQHIRYVYDRETSFVNDKGETVPWKQKDVTDGYRDIKVTPFDGCGIHHPAITDEVQFRLQLDEGDKPTTILWRAPYIKGLTAEVDYVSFYKERGVDSITDVWGVEHDVTEYAEPMIILSESMYKGKKYYRYTGTYDDWLYYWEQFEKYGHCLGVAKWNFQVETEPVFTRCNYQVLQTLDMPYEDFAQLATESVDWAQRIIDGDPFYSMCFLGLTADKASALNDYTKAVAKNPAMLKNREVRNYLISLLEKYLQDMCCGKLWIRSCFKFVLPDLVAFMEAAAGLDVVGCIGDGEFYCRNIDGALSGPKLITRNPHICKSENVVLSAVDNNLTKKYLSHLSNACIINSISLVPQRLNGCDFDGDLVLVFDDDRVLAGVDYDAIPVIDVDDKITTEPEDFTMENRLKVTLRTMKNLIGEYSNYATAYLNRCPGSDEQKEKYRTYVDIISVLTGKSIDYAKTGVLYPMPRTISKYGRPLPYFMRYASDYYKKLKLARTRSNMNRLCWELEHWIRDIHWKRTDSGFDASIMIDESIHVDHGVYKTVEAVYSRFGKDIKAVAQEVKGKDEDERRLAYALLYEHYRNKVLAICNHDVKLAANITVMLSLEHKSWNSKFPWIVAGAGVVQNVKQVDAPMPVKNLTGELTYLGKRYAWAGH